MTDEGLVAVQLKKPFRDGTVSVEMDPLSLVSRLAASVHPPRFHTVRYGGVLAPHAKWRPLVVPPPPPEAVNADRLRQQNPQTRANASGKPHLLK